VHRSEVKRRSRESEAQAHGFDGKGSNWSRYWAFSGEESPWVWWRFSRKIKGEMREEHAGYL
jgi:hypothetical protein